MELESQVQELQARIEQLEIREERRTVGVNLILFIPNFLLTSYLFVFMTFTVPVIRKSLTEMIDEPLPLPMSALLEGRSVWAGLLLAILVGLPCYQIATRFRHRLGLAVNSGLLVLLTLGFILIWQALVTPFLVHFQ